MPLFYFHVYDGMLVAPGDEGLKLANIEAARDEAVRGARSLLSDEILKGLQGWSRTITAHFRSRMRTWGTRSG